MPNPLRQDPTRTKTLRRKFKAEGRKRTRRLRANVRHLIAREDVFGLKLLNTRWALNPVDQQLDLFGEWFRREIDDELLDSPGGVLWSSEFIEEAYEKGVLRGFADVKRSPFEPQFPAAQEEFLRATRVARQSQIELLKKRSFKNLRGIGDVYDQVIVSELAEGLNRGDSASSIANRLNARIRGVSKTRLEALAETEVTRFHAEGQLDAFEQLGIEEVDVLAEWRTAGDFAVCPQCRSLQGVVLKIKKARGLIPRHPRCRCSFVPALEGVERKGRRTKKRSVQRAIRQSLKKETGEKSTKEARKSSKWIGAKL